MSGIIPEWRRLNDEQKRNFLTFFIAGLFSYVLSMVFAEAVRYKEENDLTI